MPIPAFLTKIFTGGASNIVDSVGKIVDNLNVSGEEKAKIQQEMTNEINRHMEAIGTQANQETELYLKDLDSARNMQIEALKQDDKFAKRYLYYLATAIILMTFIFDTCLFFVEIPERNHDLVNMVAGTLNTTGFAAIVYFFFGSSKSSQDKQKHLDAK